MTVFDMNPKAMENLSRPAPSAPPRPREVVERSEVVLTSLPASPDVEAIYLDAGGLVDRAKPGTILIDLSSVLPVDAAQDRAAGQGARRALPGGAGQRRRQRARAAARWPSWSAAMPQPLERATPGAARRSVPNIFHVGPGRAPATP